MSVKFEDRPIEKVREETIDQLVMNYSHGELSAEAFERRLDQAMDTKEHNRLAELVSDLPLKADTQYENIKERQFTPNYTSGDDEQNQKVISILGSNERSGQWVVPREITVYTLLGSTELDFTDAVFQHQHVTINVMSGLSSVDVFVPEGVNVVSKVFNIIGSTENKAPSMGGRQAPVITIEGYSVLGSVEVKIKQTIKEKFVAFANSLKEAFNSKNMS
ncbi:cell wall-active antibiotic response 4TMS protein YvqF [Idiomarina loihiensis]|uniref:DUF1707 SHOCT-like domain-containing protein n=1 Tax=Idiomarina TaxID=135575 RepID=UPI000D70B831|nr:MULTISPECIES: LiaF domain-containing protein [Idiomarina]PWW36894.1 cell wall-active antibiotic response 4TMS protein YvqF [Idiomarina loihiensis]TDP46702.1 cell wall-active antibiotic response 4TMS protein YvqF [Idiomarina loihiensis]TDS22973.1 cell wall-active antibiotic response 4TMS protein YvqF [Idiomarina sp. H2]